MRPLLLILNGKAGARDDVRQAVHAARDRGLRIDVRLTWEAGDAAFYAAEAARHGDEAQAVVAGGGDGTVNEVLNGLLLAPRQIAMAIVALGTANDFATSAGLPIGDTLAALELAASGQAWPVDVGEVNGRRFLNVASGGFGAETTDKAPPRLKQLLGGGAYALTAAVMAVSNEPWMVRVRCDGHDYEGEVTMLAVGNARQAGGGALLTPRARIDDGLLDVMLVPNHARDQVAHLLADMLELKHGESERFQYLRTASLDIESSRQLQFNLDGEAMRDTRFAFSVRSGALPLVLPAGCPLLGAA